MALAIMKPPMNRKIIGLAKAAKASFILTTPNTTQRVGPSNEVTGMGMGSVIHQRATRVMMASNLWASGVRPPMGVIQTNNAQMGPKTAVAIKLRIGVDSSLLLFGRDLLYVDVVHRLYCLIIMVAFDWTNIVNNQIRYIKKVT